MKTKKAPARKRSPSRLDLSKQRAQIYNPALAKLLWTTVPVSPTSGIQFPNPDHYTDPGSFARHYLASEVLSKYDDGLPSQAKVDETWRRFFAAEELCRLTNERLSAPSFGPNPFDGRSPYAAIWLARQKMEKLLGRFSWEEASRYFDWGPGATTRIPRKRSAAAYKYSGRPETTIGNAMAAEAVISAEPLWKESVGSPDEAGLHCNIVAGNRVVTVPKSFKTDRTIAIEPCMNMYIQKGIGECIRRRLKRAGIDLDDQSKNQRLARIGSFAGSLATIDLSMASDCLAYRLVEMLVPPEWFDALELCRSPFGILPSDAGQKLVQYQKFSSMGNGYTFELETAVFFCLSLAVAELYREKEPRISVYGDDIICPSSMALPLIATLEVAGFRTNESKTFVSGPFRESCGKHYFQGYEVTPFYIKRPTERLSDVFLLHNQLYRWMSRMRPIIDVDVEFRPLLQLIRSWSPKAWRKPRIPDGFGDGAFIGTFDECTPRLARNGLEGYWVQHQVTIRDKAADQPETLGRLIASLSGLTGVARSDIWNLLKNECDSKFHPRGDVQDIPRRVTVRSLVRSFPPI